VLTAALVAGPSGALLVAGALLFGFVSGSNDGGTLVSLSTRTSVIPPGTALVLLALFVTVGPLLVGTAVATTVAHRLVSFGGAGGRPVLLAAVVASLLVVFALTRLGLSTSLTLALIGGIVGAGVGDGLRVSWGVVGGVLATGLAAPLAAVGVAYLLTRLASALPASWWVERPGRLLQGAGFSLQCLAYSANDAQKMVALLALGTGVLTAPVAVHWDTQLALGVLYALGVVVGVRPLAGRIAERVLPVRSANAVVLELSAAAVVLGSSALGAPISSTQAATTALVGTGLASSSHRVRWHEVASIGTAWVSTLPSSLALGIVAGLAVRTLR
jgi:PiT family inorganic phosphate transporter